MSASGARNMPPNISKARTISSLIVTGDQEKDWSISTSCASLLTAGQWLCRGEDAKQKEITDPEEAVDLRKMRHLGRAADTYVKIRDIVEELRFDIITIIGEENDPHPQLEHIQDAFNPLLI